MCIYDPHAFKWTFAVADMDQGLVKVFYPAVWSYEMFVRLFNVRRFQEQLDEFQDVCPNIEITEVYFRL